MSHSLLPQSQSPSLELENPEEILNLQRRRADAIRFIIAKHTMVFGGRDGQPPSKHVKIEAWHAIASICGCLPRIVSVEENEDGILARAQIVKFSNGMVIGEDDALVGRDEMTWFGGTGPDKWGKIKTWKPKPKNQIRSFAKTRAIRQACKAAFSSVIILMEEEGVRTDISAEERAEETQEVPQLPAPLTKEQTITIRDKMKAAGLDEKEMVRRYGPSKDLNQESFKAVVASLDGIIASREGAQEG